MCLFDPSSVYSLALHKRQSCLDPFGWKSLSIKNRGYFLISPCRWVTSAFCLEVLPCHLPFWATQKTQHCLSVLERKKHLAAGACTIMHEKNLSSHHFTYQINISFTSCSVTAVFIDLNFQQQNMIHTELPPTELFGGIAIADWAGIRFAFRKFIPWYLLLKDLRWNA